MLQRAAEDAVGPEHVTGMVRRAVRAGLEGNYGATKMVLDRVCGRPPEAQREVEPTEVALPNLSTAANCTTAIDRIIAGIAAGTIDLPTAKFLLDAVEKRMKAIGLHDHEEQLVELEKQAALVDLGGTHAKRT